MKIKKNALFISGHWQKGVITLTEIQAAPRRMRTIDAAAAYIAEGDAHTCLTKTALRRLCASGTLPTVRIGTKYLIDLDTLEAFLCGQAARQ